MKVEFADKDLERCAIDEAFAKRRLGAKRAEIYLKRLRSIESATDFKDLQNYPGSFHELVGNRKGQWACSLDQPYRLIMKGSEPDTVVIWSEVDEAEILEIVDYH